MSVLSFHNILVVIQQRVICSLPRRCNHNYFQQVENISRLLAMHIFLIKVLSNYKVNLTLPLPYIKMELHSKEILKVSLNDPQCGLPDAGLFLWRSDEFRYFRYWHDLAG